MGQPLATCCNPNTPQIITDIELDPPPQEPIVVAKNSIDIA